MNDIIDVPNYTCAGKALVQCQLMEKKRLFLGKLSAVFSKVTPLRHSVLTNFV